MDKRFDQYGYLPLTRLNALEKSHLARQSFSLARQGNNLSYHQNIDKIVSKQISFDKSVRVSNDFRLAIVKPIKAQKPNRSDIKIYKNLTLVQPLNYHLEKLTGLLAVDIETNGYAAHDPDVKIIGIGIANFEHIIYIDYNSCSARVKRYVLDFLSNYSQGLVGHNILFDGTFFLRDTGKWLDWRYDTFGMYRQLANEGYAGQKYGLKPAQIDLLGWEDRGDVELDRWLIDNGHVKGTSKDKPNKSMMYLAPPEILGYYCGLDAISTYQLIAECFLPSIKGQLWEQTFLDYHQVYIDNLAMLGEQQLEGITIDKPALVRHQAKLEQDIQTAYDKFLNEPEVIVFREIRKAEEINQLRLKEPKKYLKAAKKSEVISKNWQKWSDKTELAGKIEWFNPNSGQQLQALFYDHLKSEVIVRTDSGQPSTGAKALPGLGHLGKLLKAYKDLVKEQSYVEKCLEMLRIDNEGIARVHPQFSAPGTLTCRLAGSGGLNVQQLPKSVGYLSCWRPMAEDETWVDFDIASLEQIVLAELSQDKSLLELYGPGAKKGQDVYLFNGYSMPVIGQEIRDAGYHPEMFSKESVSEAKVIAKKARSIAKVITLAASYGAGPGKIRDTLAVQGIKITFDEAKLMHQGYWKLYSGVKQYSYYLEKQHAKNNGYVLNGIGRPVCCAADYLKDLVNRVVQSTGHDILMLVISEMRRLRELSGNLKLFKPVIIDFHDESLISCKKQDVEKVINLVKQAYKNVNLKLSGMMPIREEGGEVSSLAECKIESAILEQYKQEILDIPAGE